VRKKADKNIMQSVGNPFSDDKSSTMSPQFEDDCIDLHYVDGCHGTLADQRDEAFYDDRFDADDDIAKGKIKFPENKLYGREDELDKLLSLYDLTGSKSDNPFNDTGGNSICSTGSRVVFLSGHSGVGKSALVREFLESVRRNHFDEDLSQDNFFYAIGNCKKRELANDSSLFCQVFESIVQQLLATEVEITAIGHEVCGQSNPDELKRVDTTSKVQARRTPNNEELVSKIRSKIRTSGLIGPGTDGNVLLLQYFPILRSFLHVQFFKDESAISSDGPAPDFNTNIGEFICEFLTLLCHCIEKGPLVLILDDLQWADSFSIEILSRLLLDQCIQNILVICSYRSNQIRCNDQLSTALSNIQQVRGKASSSSLTRVEKIDLFFLSPHVITQFIADSLNKERPDDVVDLAEVVYRHTMGNISHVMRTLEELVSKNALYYDVISFDWSWTDISELNIEDKTIFSENILESIKQKIAGMPRELQRMLTIMACVPKTSNLLIIKEAMHNEGFDLEVDDVFQLLTQACSSGMLIPSRNSDSHIFAHELIEEGFREVISEEDRDGILIRAISSRFRCLEGRINRIEVFDENYSPMEWEAKEMSSLVEFLGVNPSAPTSRGSTGTSTPSRGTELEVVSNSGESSEFKLSKNKDNSYEKGRLQAAIDAKLRNRSRRVSVEDTFPRLHKSTDGDDKNCEDRCSDDKIGDSSRSHSSDFVLLDDDTSGLLGKKLKPSSLNPGVNIAKFLTEVNADRGSKKQKNVVDPKTATEDALELLFFPSTANPKSILLKHGPISIKSSTTSSSDNQRICGSIASQHVMLLFSRGFVVASFDKRDIFPLFLALNNQEILSETSFLLYVQARLNQSLGEKECMKKNIIKLLHELGLPECEQILPHDGTKLLAELETLQRSRLRISLTRNGGLRRISDYREVTGAQEQAAAKPTKVESAVLFSSVVLVQSLDLCSEDDYLLDHKTIPENSFALTLSERKNNPVVFEFSSTKERDIWLDSFGKCVVRQHEISTDTNMMQLKSKLGWQHLVIRSHYSSFVIENDAESLDRVIRRNETSNGCDAWFSCIDKIDEYNGYAPLHYAALLGRKKCMEVLLEAGADVSVKDRNGFSPMHYATKKRRNKCLALLEQYGAVRLNDEPNKRKFGLKKQASIRGLDMIERSDYDSDSGSRSLQSHGSNREHRTVRKKKTVQTDAISGRRASSAEALLRTKTLSTRSFGNELKS